MGKDKYLVNRIESLTSNHGIEPDKSSRLNALLYRILTSKGVISYDIKDIEHLFNTYSEINIKEICQTEEPVANFIVKAIGLIKNEANLLTTGSIHIHFFANQDNTNTIIGSLDKLEMDEIDTSVGIWYCEISKIEILIMSGKNITTYERDLHR